MVWCSFHNGRPVKEDNVVTVDVKAVSFPLGARGVGFEVGVLGFRGLVSVLRIFGLRV